MSLPRFEAGQLLEPDGAVKPYVILLGGPQAMVVVPGAADGLRTCTDVAVYLAWFYRRRLKSCRLLVLSRREPMPPDFGIARHADDMIRTVEQLGWGPAVWECLSAGGPVGQQVALKRPDLVQGLIFTSTYDYVAERTRKVLQQWIFLAQHQSGPELFSSVIESKYRPPAEVLADVNPSLLQAASRSRDPQRLVHILQELLDLDQRAITPQLSAPALVIGGQDDRIVPAEVQREMAARIPGARLRLCPGFGHFHDMENPQYHDLVAQFVQDVAYDAANARARGRVQ